MHTYDEVIGFDDITNDELFNILKQHSSSMIEYFADNNSKQFYAGTEILDWLGY